MNTIFFVLKIQRNDNSVLNIFFLNYGGELRVILLKKKREYKDRGIPNLSTRHNKHTSNTQASGKTKLKTTREPQPTQNTKPRQVVGAT